MKSSKSGFTLFEMVLVLAVITMMMMAYYAFEHRKRETSASDVLAYKLYQYGAAVNAYARDNPDEFDPIHKPLPEHPFYGYEWLQSKQNKNGVAYLDAHFNLNISPLTIGALVEATDSAAQQVLETTFTFVSHPNQPDTFEIQQIKVGPIYAPMNPAQGGTPENPWKPAIDLASKAAYTASNYSDQDGTARIHYTVDITDPHSPIIGVPKNTSAAGDEWLKVDGSNQMVGNIAFAAPDAGQQPYTLTGEYALDFSGNQRSVVPRFKGFQYWEGTATTANSNPNTVRTSLKPSKSICFLGGAKYPEDSQGECTVAVDFSGEWIVKAENKKHTHQRVTCTARCLIFDW